MKLSSYFSLVCETSIKAIDKNTKGQQQLKTIDEMDKPCTFVHQSIFTSSFTDVNLGIKKEEVSKEKETAHCCCVLRQATRRATPRRVPSLPRRGRGHATGPAEHHGMRGVVCNSEIVPGIVTNILPETLQHF